jgi:hypothetical protein
MSAFSVCFQNASMLCACIMMQEFCKLFSGICQKQCMQGGWGYFHVTNIQDVKRPFVGYFFLVCGIVRSLVGQLLGWNIFFISGNLGQRLEIFCEIWNVTITKITKTKFIMIVPQPTAGASFRALARGEGTNSARLFTPGKREALAKSKVHQWSRAWVTNRGWSSSLI